MADYNIPHICLVSYYMEVKPEGLKGERSHQIRDHWCEDGWTDLRIGFSRLKLNSMITR